MSGQWEGGKGSKQRPTNKSKFDENYDKIFGKKSYNTIEKKEEPSKKPKGK